MKTTTIQTDRLTLRRSKPSDIAGLRVLLGDIDVMRYSGLDTSDYIRLAEAELVWLKDFEASDGGIRWVITQQNDDSYIGDIGFLEYDQANKRAEISYKLAKDQWGKGIMSESFRAVLGYGFKTLGLNKVTALVHNENASSLKLLQRYGFKVEGTLREHEYLNGCFADVVYLGLLRSEWG